MARKPHGPEASTEAPTHSTLAIGKWQAGGGCGADDIRRGEGLGGAHLVSPTNDQASTRSWILLGLQSWLCRQHILCSVHAIG